MTFFPNSDDGLVLSVHPFVLAASLFLCLAAGVSKASI